MYTRATSNVMTYNSFTGEIDVNVNNASLGVMLGKEEQAKRRVREGFFRGKHLRKQSSPTRQRDIGFSCRRTSIRQV